MDQKKIGAFLKSLRTEKGLTQEQLAEQFHVSSRTVSRWETGSNMPDISLLAPLADFYDVDVREIMEGVRKSEMMNEELKDVAVKMADYAGEEKGRLFKWVRVIGFIGVAVLSISIVLQCVNYEPNFLKALSIFTSFIALIAFAVTTFYACGILGKLAKKKGFNIVVRIITIVLIVISARFMLSIALVFGIAFFEMAAPFKNLSGVENYDKQALIDEYGGDLNSSLRVFPDDTDTAKNLTYDSHLKTGLFDTDGYIILKADYDEDAFSAEVDRLSEIECTLLWQDQSVTNKIRYDTESYKYPAYVASDGYDSTYEYALIDEENDSIIYIYISYPESSILKLPKYSDYLKKNLLEYGEHQFDSSLEEFTIYAHSFEEGIWMETD